MALPNRSPCRPSGVRVSDWFTIASALHDPFGGLGFGEVEELPHELRQTVGREVEVDGGRERIILGFDRICRGGLGETAWPGQGQGPVRAERGSRRDADREGVPRHGPGEFGRTLVTGDVRRKRSIGGLENTVGKILRRTQPGCQKVQGHRSIRPTERGPIVDLAREQARKIPHGERCDGIVARHDRHQRIERQNPDTARQGRIVRRLVARGKPLGRIGFAQGKRHVDLAVQEGEESFIRGSRVHEEPGCRLIVGPDKRVDDGVAVLRAGQIQALLRTESRQEIGQKTLGHGRSPREIGLRHETGEIGAARPGAGHALGGDGQRAVDRVDLVIGPVIGDEVALKLHRAVEGPQLHVLGRCAVNASCEKKGGRRADRPRAVEHVGGVLLALIGGESQVAEHVLQDQSIAHGIAGRVGEAQRHHLRRRVIPHMEKARFGGAGAIGDRDGGVDR
jgi:hypothetical protein